MSFEDQLRNLIQTEIMHAFTDKLRDDLINKNLVVTITAVGDINFSITLTPDTYSHVPKGTVSPPPKRDRRTVLI